ncbi:1,4-alpha-glucan branching protein GlgB [Waddlia chondrophila]|uniref:1,4-alpha-glucan branching enzyme GlgB n=1 Tax=Waddlia chondrophila (strain ATCC VR-1470 / WSU 86-1044) TaxID=716544 RepID=D6YT24_WADCW|nr:1,4-alpha-glucan branching protein GlgB [Waddlia chondrophila]ADI39219.1 1,4-alpha-glucan branching enzyme [Waddlia chondrophila WSU 86-1044]
MKEAVAVYSLLSEKDIYLFKEGTHDRLYEKLGSHVVEVDGIKGTQFAVWAPNAESVSVIGDFNDWDRKRHQLHVRWDESGIWEGFIPGAKQGDCYKYHIASKVNGYRVEKGDPFAFFAEVPPKTGSIIWDLAYEWKSLTEERSRSDKPISIYEMHFGSWRRDEKNTPPSYREMAEWLPPYLLDMGFTHVEFMPMMEHPFYGSWGYQKTGYFSPTSRYGSPQDFMFLIESLHQAGIGVFLDWVPSHFPSDQHGLAFFDGTHLFEHEDPKKGIQPDWNSYIFNYGRNEVRSFLTSSANFWCSRYHIDGLRCDAVASMLYLDYSRKNGEWIPNAYGGNENLEAIDFLKTLNTTIYQNHPHVQMIAEESTAWPMVSRPVYLGGLGFGWKWNMGWMNDTLEYFKKDPVHRKYHHNELIFSILYAFTESFVLSLSHDEVVHGKASLLTKMPGDEWQKFANLRLLYGYMFTHPGKKLLFMGSEIAPWTEWHHEAGLEWHILDYERHAGIQRWVRDLNKAYCTLPALHQLDFSEEGFSWIDCSDWENGVLSYSRKGFDPKDTAVVILNLTPVPRENYKIGVPFSGNWQEVLNSDSHYYGGSDKGNFGRVASYPIAMHGHDYALSLTLPPLAMICLSPE